MAIVLFGWVGYTLVTRLGRSPLWGGRDWLVGAGAGFLVGAVGVLMAVRAARRPPAEQRNPRLGIAYTLAMTGVFFVVFSSTAFDDTLPGVAALAALLTIEVQLIAFFVLGILGVRLSRGPVEHRVEVWDVQPYREGDFEPYFIARCDCDWVGEPHDADMPGAEEAARGEATAHHPNVVPGTTRPLA